MLVVAHLNIRKGFSHSRMSSTTTTIHQFVKLGVIIALVLNHINFDVQLVFGATPILNHYFPSVWYEFWPTPVLNQM